MQVQGGLLCCLLFLSLASGFTTYKRPHGNARKQALDNILKRYDGNVPPNYEDAYGTNVKVQLIILTLDSVNEQDMEYSLMALIQQRWHDHRLRYPKLEGIEKLELSPKSIKKIWVPDMYIVNAKWSTFHDVLVPNKLMHIFPNGSVIYSVRVSARLSCHLNLYKYPFDTQICNMVLETYTSSSRNIMFAWSPDPVRTSDELMLPQFTLEKIRAKAQLTKRNIDTFSTLISEFTLVRQYGYHVTQIYIPSILIVVLSWVSFWLDPKAVPARVSLGVLTVLAMTTQSNSALSSLPHVSYIKALDVYMAVCLMFVAGGLIEFAYVNVRVREEQSVGIFPDPMPATKPSVPSEEDTEKDEREQFSMVDPPRFSNEVNEQNERFTSFATSTSDPEPESIRGSRWTRRNKTLVWINNLGRKLPRVPMRLHKVDAICRILFPLAFAIFNACYWGFYLNII